jgi:hypothetical protein
MFVPQNQNQFRTANADVQMFYAPQSSLANQLRSSWNKPTGVSHVYIMLIGSGGQGGGEDGGGSAAVTVWYGAAQHVPDILYLKIDSAGNSGGFTAVYGRFSSSTPVELLRAESANGFGGGASTAANNFSASGFYQSVAGQNGSSGSISASPTTFLSGGSYSSSVAANYGYTNSAQGLFFIQPLIVSVGGSSGGRGGVGSGAGGNTVQGGPGFALIASW